MVRISRIEIEKFNGQIFYLWKLKMKYLIVDKEQWVTMDLGSAHMGMAIQY